MSLVHNKYFKAFITAIHFQLSSKAQLIARIGLYSLIVYLFSQVFTATGAEDERIWYVATTQLIVLSVCPLAFQMAQDFSNNKYESFLLKPFNYLSLRYCEAMGASIIQYITLFACYLLLCRTLTNTFPEIRSLLLGFFYGILSMTLYLVMNAIIGLFSFWVRDIKTLHFLNLTAAFCFGGLIVPLESYSAIMKQICFCTPYPWILWAPAQMTNNMISIYTSVAFISAWIFLFYFILRIVNNRCEQSFLHGNN